MRMDMVPWYLKIKENHPEIDTIYTTAWICMIVIIIRIMLDIGFLKKHSMCMIKLVTLVNHEITIDNKWSAY